MKDKIYAYKDGRLGHVGSPTSVKAAEMHYIKAQSWAGKVYRHLELAGDNGCTDGELYDSLNYSSVRPRRIGLVHLGLVGDSGERRTCRTTGMEMTVWKLRRFIHGEAHND